MGKNSKGDWIVKKEYDILSDRKSYEVYFICKTCGVKLLRKDYQQNILKCKCDEVKKFLSDKWLEYWID